jgi:hypothetical protein
MRIMPYKHDITLPCISLGGKKQCSSDKHCSMCTLDTILEQVINIDIDILAEEWVMKNQHMGMAISDVLNHTIKFSDFIRNKITQLNRAIP